jgi:hypothetical protein
VGRQLFRFSPIGSPTLTSEGPTLNAWVRRLRRQLLSGEHAQARRLTGVRSIISLSRHGIQEVKVHFHRLVNGRYRWAWLAAGDRHARGWRGDSR